MESRGEQIKKSSKVLCQSVVDIDALEDRLTNEIIVLKDFNLLTTTVSSKNTKELM
ncbi:MAG: hypothetical protein ACJA0T_003231 [Colwellia sp.]|jgi:hypothetical protein